jgi:hypothetical protein
MSQGTTIRARSAFMRFFSGLCLVGIVCGVALCMIKGNGMQGYTIRSAALTYSQQARQAGLNGDAAAYMNALARQTMLQAIAYEPHNAENWKLLAAILDQESNFAAANQARALAEALPVPAVVTPAFAAPLPSDTAALERD